MYSINGALHMYVITKEDYKGPTGLIGSTPKGGRPKMINY